MRGRKPKPNSLHELHGGTRKRKNREPQFSRSEMVAPEWLTPIARIEWRRVVLELSALDMLRGVDEAQLCGYVQSYARWRQAEEVLEREGVLLQEPVVSKAGVLLGERTRRHPATLISKDEKAAMSRFAALFGLDPTNRSRIDVTPKESKSRLDQILDGDDEDDGLVVN